MAAKGATKQLLLMLLWGSCNLEVTQNMRTLLHGCCLQDKMTEIGAQQWDIR